MIIMLYLLFIFLSVLMMWMWNNWFLLFFWEEIDSGILYLNFCSIRFVGIMFSFGILVDWIIVDIGFCFLLKWSVLYRDVVLLSLGWMLNSDVSDVWGFRLMVSIWWLVRVRYCVKCVVVVVFLFLFLKFMIEIICIGLFLWCWGI